MSQPNASGAARTICTIGDLVLDVVALPDGPLIPDADTPATIRLIAGGQAANVAAWASALGARARLICKRGTDLSSHAATDELQRHGVEICGPRQEGRGGIVVSIRDTLGHRTMASDRGVAGRLDATELDSSWLEDCDVLHVSGYCLLREPMAEAAIEAARHAPRVSVDLASAGDIERAGARRFAARLEALSPDLAFATETERKAVPSFDTSWVIKLGARGAHFPEGLYAAPDLIPLDTTGAGDALAAGYLVGGPDLAIEAARRCIGVVGAMPSDQPAAHHRNG
jgi:sugar/nucleoside kinase (ribokinase family)